METLKKAIENRKAPFEVESKAGGRVISLRVSERMEQLLEKQAQEWNMSISDTLRGILNFYFLPPLLYEAWEQKVQALIDLDTQQKGKNRADLNASTLAQRIKPVFCDSYEAEEYALFVQGLWDKNMKYFEALREEGKAISTIAGDMLLATAEALQKANFPDFEEVEP